MASHPGLPEHPCRVLPPRGVEHCQSEAGPQQVPDGDEGESAVGVCAHEEAVPADGHEEQEVCRHHHDGRDAGAKHPKPLLVEAIRHVRRAATRLPPDVVGVSVSHPHRQTTRV